MGRLKSESLKKCVSLLREFINDSTAAGEKRETAILALEQLGRITAGGESYDDPETPGEVEVPGSVDFMCTGRPRAYSSTIFDNGN